MPRIRSRGGGFAGGSLAPALLLLCTAACSSPPARRQPLSHGPFVGHVDTTSATVWMRTDPPAEAAVRVLDAAGGSVVAEAAAAPDPSADGTLAVVCRGLAPSREYLYEVRVGGELVAGGAGFRFRTPPPPGAPARVSLAFGSCADHDRFPRQPVWARIRASGAEGMVLLGDTPYINSTDLADQRRRRGEFVAQPDLAACLRGLPFWGTWDDHDFGGNDVTGLIAGKSDSRKAFLEYHANPSAGDGREGIYTRFRWGPVEVFLLDTRWFADTGPSFADSGEKTLLGERQWEWLTAGLAASDAPFKILACGIVWNGSVRPLKKDHWMNWEHERDALFSFIGRKRIPGVVLVGGDIHRSRIFRFDVDPVAGYDLTEFISSPLANHPMAVAKVASPECLADAEDPHSFLLVTADTLASPPALSGRVLTSSGRELFGLTLDLPSLTPR